MLVIVDSRIVRVRSFNTERLDNLTFLRCYCFDGLLKVRYRQMQRFAHVCCPQILEFEARHRCAHAHVQ